MAASSLKRYSQGTIPAATATAVGVAPAAARALVISKIAVANTQNASVTFALYIGTSAVTANLVAYNVVLQQGQVYTETGLVALTGEQVYVYVFGAVANAVTVSVHGEEVDN